MQETCIFINLNVNEETLYFNFYVNIGIIPHSKIQFFFFYARLVSSVFNYIA